jgi:hypothetical protein
MDLRHAALGPRGYKLKPVKSGLSSLRKVQQAAEQQQQEPQGMDTDAAELEPYAAPAVKRQRAEGVAYRNVSAAVVRWCSKQWRNCVCVPWMGRQRALQVLCGSSALVLLQYLAFSSQPMTVCMPW